MQKNTSGTMIIMDAHVHIHECFKINDFLDSAWNNFSRAARVFFNTEKFTPVLFLTESSGADQFKVLKERAAEAIQKGSLINEWVFRSTKEENSITCLKNEEMKIIIIAGRQIVTKEKLEVLGLGIMNGIEDGTEIRHVVNDIEWKGGIAVIPWGVGKWIGEKRKLVRQILDSEDTSLFIGDNGNRPFFWSNKKIFMNPGKKNYRNISGSDPLPFKSENGRAGSFGFAMEGFLNFDKPFENLRNKLLVEQPELFHYGKLETAFRFFRNQFLMQIKKKLR